MPQITVSQADIIQLSNLMKILKRSKFEITGDEIPSMGQAVAWLSTRHTEIENLLKEPPKSSPGVMPELVKRQGGQDEGGGADKPVIRRRRKG